MEIQSQQSLKNYNTFGIDVKATRFAIATSVADLQALIQLDIEPKWILGGGSNLLLTKNVKGLTIKNEIKGIDIQRNYKKSVHLSVGGGENWHQLVLWAVQHNLGGIENLSLIPGTVGAAPIQNIGAYGVELKDVFHQLEAVDLKTGKIKIFSKADCLFGYRDSIFKKKLKGKYAISRVVLKLTKVHQLNTSYGAIQDLLESKKIKKPTIKDISDIIIAIRNSKLPDPAKIGNSGSFFKNPVVSASKFKQLQKTFPNIKAYPLPSGKVKIPAGWLIEQCGWKGKRVGNTGCYKNQALVLVNHGGATGKEVYRHALRIMKSVEETFGVQIFPEVNVL